MSLITIFTPTYNRCQTLQRLYDSLLKQTCSDFEWIIVDDGSTDDTKQLIDRFRQKQDSFEIIYVFQDNKGKHVAINKGVALASGRCFFIVDSDDYLPDDSIETIVKWEKSIDGCEGYAGVAGLRSSVEGELIGSTFEGEYLDATSLEREDNNISGDKAEVFYTEVLKQYPFPFFEGEKFMSEEVVWNRIAADGYKLRWFNKTVYVSEYQSDGLSANWESNLAKNPKGFALSVRERIKNQELNRARIDSLYCYYFSLTGSHIGLKGAAENLGISHTRIIEAIISNYVQRLIRKLMIHPVKSVQAHLQNWTAANYEKSRYGKKIAGFQNAHKGERCFFIGNGPSLRADDLTKLHENNEVCFAFNRIYHIFDQTDWRPTYFISQDEKMLAGCQDAVDKTEMGIKFIPIQMRWYHDIHGIDMKGAEWFSLKTGIEEKGKPLEFSDMPQKVVYNSSTGMYTAAQFAAFMGFKEIYLIGVDHSFRTSRNNRGEIVIDNEAKDYFTDQYNEDKDSLYIPNTEKSTLTYIAMKEQCEQRGIGVFNATRGGKLEVFERVDFDTLFE